jgi:hypothetical protein
MVKCWKMREQMMNKMGLWLNQFPYAKGNYKIELPH